MESTPKSPVCPPAPKKTPKPLKNQSDINPHVVRNLTPEFSALLDEKELLVSETSQLYI